MVRTASGNIAVFRTEDDEVFALDDRCPHKGGPLSQGIVHNKRVTCPLHNFVIELASGEAVAPDEGCAHVASGARWRTAPCGCRFVRPRPLPPSEGNRRVPVKTTCPYCGVGCGVVADRDRGGRGHRPR